MTVNDTATDKKLSDDEQKILDSALYESDHLLARSLKEDQHRRTWWLAMCVLVVVLAGGWVVSMISPASIASGPSESEAASITQHLEDFRRTAICYDLSFDQVLDDQLSIYDEGRLEMFPGDAWPSGLVLDLVRRYASDFQVVTADVSKYRSDEGGAYLFTERLEEPLQVANYHTLVFDSGIGPNGAVVIDSYAAIYCNGNMDGVINSQSYSTTIIDGNMGGKLRNASYGHWVIKGDFAGKFENESAGTLRILGAFNGKIRLWDRENRFSKVFIAGHTPQSMLDNISGSGAVYLEKSDLPDGEHRRGGLTVVVGDYQIAPDQGKANQGDFKKAWQRFFKGQYVRSEALFRTVLESDPENPHAMNGLGWSLLNQKKHAEAKPWLEKAIAIEDEHWGALNGLAVILKDEGRVDEAVDLWERIAAGTDEPNDAAEHLAEIYLERKDFDKAEPHFRSLIKWFPDREDLKTKLAEVEDQLEDQE